MIEAKVATLSSAFFFEVSTTVAEILSEALSAILNSAVNSSAAELSGVSFDEPLVTDDSPTSKFNSLSASPIKPP